MYDVLADTFIYNLEQYGKYITVNNKSVKALFKTDKKIASNENKDQYLTMFTAYVDNVQQGDEIILNGKHYLALKDNTDENTVYNKTYCIDCNQLIKYELRRENDAGADLTCFYVSADNLSASVNIADGVTTLQSVCHFTFQLSDLTKRININERFFAGQSKTGVWKIRDINYQNGFCEVYCIRDLIKDTDDTANMIADRWKFEHKPDTYDVLIEPSEFTIAEEETQQLSIVVKRNDIVIDPTPEITYSISNPEVVSVDPVTNIVIGLKEGTATITGSYKEASNDIVHVDSTKASVTPNTIIGDIVVNPTYKGTDSHYSLTEYSKQTFTATLSGISSPQWNITLDPQGNTSANYTSTINNGAGTFYVENKNMSTKLLKYTISETTTGKTLIYYVKLASMF